MKEREVVNAEFVKLRTIGMAVCGRISRYDTNQNSDFVIMQPIFVRRSHDGKWQKYGAGAVGLSTDLARKISREDVGKVIMAEFKDTKESASGSPQKLFGVFELEKEEIIAMNDKAEVMPEGAKIHGDNAGGKPDDDDLPF